MKNVWMRGSFAAFALALCAATGCSNNATPKVRAQPLLARLHTLTTIGSTVDPVSGDQNPYGLAIATVTSGLVTAGDLIVCDFNDGPTNTQGQGESIVGLHPAAGSAPYRILHDPSLLGCDALSTYSNGSIWTANFNANNIVVVSTSGAIGQTLSASSTYALSNPWGAFFGTSPGGVTSFFESNAGDGTVLRLVVAGGTVTSSTTIATGLSRNNGVPGSILAPSGLTYNPANDTLYVIDGNDNSVSAIANASTIAGPATPKVLASGAPLNGPLSAALLPDGNLIVGNTLDPNGTNLLIEVSSAGGILATKNVDTGAAGALFGIVVAGTTAAPLIYFNDDNTNTVDLLST